MKVRAYILIAILATIITLGGAAGYGLYSRGADGTQPTGPQEPERRSAASSSNVPSKGTAPGPTTPVPLATREGEHAKMDHGAADAGGIAGPATEVAGGSPNQTDSKAVREGDTVNIEYSYERSEGTAAVEVGAWRLPEKIERSLLGAKVGEEKEMVLMKKEGYRHRSGPGTELPKISFYFGESKVIFRVKINSITSGTNTSTKSIGSKRISFLPFVKGMEEARKREGIAFVYFFSQYCHWCKKFEKEVLSDASVIEELKRGFTPIAVDVDK